VLAPTEGLGGAALVGRVLHLPGPPNWFDLSFVYYGFRGHESVESAAFWVLMDFCDHNPTAVALSPFGLFPAVSPHDPAWLDRVTLSSRLPSPMHPHVTPVNAAATIVDIRGTISINDCPKPK
jgi:hypothetical protein